MKPLKYGQTEGTIQPWIDQEENECVRNYLKWLNANKKRAALFIHLYAEWAKTATKQKVTSPKELLSLKNSHDNSEAEQLLDKFTLAKTDFPDSMKWQMINNIKGFYRTNYKELQSAAGHFEYVPKKAQDPPSKETCVAMYRACYTPRDKALVMAATGTSIARETLSLITWNLLEKDWTQQEIPCIIIPGEMIKGHGKGKYRGTKQVAFWTPEAKRILIEYRLWYQKTFKHNWQPTDHIFLDVREHIHQPMTKQGISRTMYNIRKRAGVKFGIHDGRITVQTALEDVGESPNWIKKVKGRKVKGEESPYSKPAIERLRAKFKAALPDLQFLTETEKPTDPRQKFLEKFADILDKYPEKMNKFEQFVLKL